MARSPHASHLHPNWGKDVEWHKAIGMPITSDDVIGIIVEQDKKKAITQGLVGIPIPPVSPVRTAAHSLPCIYLGETVVRVGCSTCRREDTRICTFKGFDRKRVSQNTTCESCTEYVEE